MTVGSNSNILLNGNSAIYAEVMLKLAILTDDDKKNLCEFLNPDNESYYRNNWIEARWGFYRLIKFGFIEEKISKKKAKWQVTDSQGTRTEYRKRYKYTLAEHGLYLRNIIGATAE